MWRIKWTIQMYPNVITVVLKRESQGRFDYSKESRSFDYRSKRLDWCEEGIVSQIILVASRR